MTYCLTSSSCEEVEREREERWRTAATATINIYQTYLAEVVQFPDLSNPLWAKSPRNCLCGQPRNVLAVETVIIQAVFPIPSIGSYHKLHMY